MLGNFGAGGKQAHGRELRADFFLPALDFHLQCYRLRCFSFARLQENPFAFTVHLCICIACLSLSSSPVACWSLLAFVVLLQSALAHSDRRCLRPKRNKRRSFGELFWPQRQNSPGQWLVQKPLKKNQENHIYHRLFFSVAPILFGKGKFFTGAGRCMLSFSQQFQCAKEPYGTKTRRGCGNQDSRAS